MRGWVVANAWRQIPNADSYEGGGDEGTARSVAGALCTGVDGVDK